VAKIAKEKGILTVGVVTKPFAFEGKKRMENAENALATFINEVDSIIVIPNQNLFRIADKNTTLKDAFVKADEVLYDGVRSITDLMIMPGLINLDFADVKKIMADGGKAIMGTGEAEGEDRARVAAEQALSNPILDDCSMKGAKGVLINIAGGSDITLMEIDEAVNIIKEEVSDTAELIFGSSYDDTLSGRIRVSIVVTGIDDEATPVVRKPVATTYVNLNTEEPKAEAPVVAEPEPIVEEAETPAPETVEEEKPAILSNVIELNQPKVVEESEPEMFAEFKEQPEEPRVPSALFSAIINPAVANTEESADVQSELSEVKTEKTFKPTADIHIIEEEPRLFPDQGEAELISERKAREARAEAEAQAMIEDEDPAPRQTFIDKILGRSRPKTKATVKPVVMPKFDEIEEFAEKESESNDDLEIPSFLRRR
jgi:cell division protein FtsZ